MNATKKITYPITEAEKITGVDHSTLVFFIQHEWILPAEQDLFDHEDLARIQLICELRNIFGANDESIPLILHLVDQLYRLREKVKAYSNPKDGDDP